MKILSIECSTVPVSAAVISDGEVLGFVSSNVKLTHSQTLFPIINSALDAAKLVVSDIDAVSVAVGPGSFTGIRIGISSAKGIAQPKGLKCVGVSTLLAAAYMFTNENAIICPAIDARCGQVYNALFCVKGGKIARICEDRAIMADELINELKNIGAQKVILCCDAAETIFKSLADKDNIILAPKPLILQNAVGVGFCAYERIKCSDYTNSAGLIPKYLKLPQAERELKEKQMKGL